LPDPADQLRKVLALERRRKFANTAVVGGLDTYLLRFAQDVQLRPSHRFSQILQALPTGGYRALHPVQRERVIDELLKAAEGGLPVVDGAPQAAARAASRSPRPPVATPPQAPPARVKPPAQPSTTTVGTLDSPVTVLKGISRPGEARLAKLGVRTVRDLLYLLPSRYDEYLGARSISRLVPDKLQTISGTVFSAGAGTVGRHYRKNVTEAIVSDQTGSVRCLWWSGTWVARRLRQGTKVTLSGKVTAFRGRLQMENAEFELPDNGAAAESRLLPVYPSTEGLSQRSLRSMVMVGLEAFSQKVDEVLPEAVRTRLRLLPIGRALRAIHAPKSAEEAEGGRRRLAYEELLYIELGVVRRRQEWQASSNAPMLELAAVSGNGFQQSLPFLLTPAQERAIAEVAADITRPSPMCRLLQGDVGSGKTVVAASALLAAVSSGCQGAIMAPTEILAEQHFRTFCTLLGPGASDDGGALSLREIGPGYVALRPPYLDRPVRVALLTGSLKTSEKTAAQAAISRGEVDIAVGTHALIQSDVEFQRLGLAVVDEQHRFGVEQRAALREKGEGVHVLVMTATPIPRTLALTVYGDLDITVLNEMPPGRLPVKTMRITSQQREQAANFVRRKVSEGRQAYVICPLVEESDAVAAKAAVQEYERLSRDVFPDLRLGLLHGRIGAGDKESTMRAFRDGELDILVSTAVVEVGVDVPNTTVMMIEGADRFGLTQLHQFRGRVRRGTEQAYCLLLSENASEDAEERLRIMETVDDGFKLAEEDLRLRGPGEYFGTRQSGMPDLHAARLTDVDLIELARAEATRILAEDPPLSRPEHANLRFWMKQVWDRVSGDVS